MALPLTEPAAIATLRAVANSIGPQDQGHEFAQAVVTAISAVQQELAEIHGRNENAHLAIAAAQGALEECHGHLRQQHDGLEGPLFRLQQFVGGVAVDGGVAATTLVARIASLEQVAAETVGGVVQRLAALETAMAAARPVPGAALPSSSQDARLCQVTSRHVKSCRVASRHAMSCHVI